MSEKFDDAPPKNFCPRCGSEALSVHINRPRPPAQTLDHLDWREPGVPPDAERWWFVQEINGPALIGEVRGGCMWTPSQITRGEVAWMEERSAVMKMRSVEPGTFPLNWRCAPVPS